MRVITRRLGETAYIYKNQQRVGIITYVTSKTPSKGHQVRISNEYQNFYRNFYFAAEHLFSQGGHVVFYHDMTLGERQLKMIFNLPSGVEVRTEPLSLSLAS